MVCLAFSSHRLWFEVTIYLKTPRENYLSKNINWFELSCLEFEHILSERLLHNSNFLTLTCSLICHFHHHWLPSWKISEIRMMLVNYHIFVRGRAWRIVSGEHVFWCWSFGKAGIEQIEQNDPTREKPWDFWCQSDFCMAISWYLGQIEARKPLKTVKSRSRDTSTIPPVIPYLRVLKPTLPFNSTEDGIIPCAASHFTSSFLSPHIDMWKQWHLNTTFLCWKVYTAIVI